MITPSQIRRIHALLNQVEEMAYKQEYVMHASANRVHSIKELSVHEAQYCIAIIGEVQRGERKPSNHFSPLGLKFKPMPHIVAPVAPSETEAQRADKLRKRILAICHNMAWYKRAEDNALLLANGKPQLDYPRIDAYCAKYGSQHKALNQHSASELGGNGGLVWQFTQLEKGIYKEKTN